MLYFYLLAIKIKYKYDNFPYYEYEKKELMKIKNKLTIYSNTKHFEFCYLIPDYSSNPPQKSQTKAYNNF